MRFNGLRDGLLHVMAEAVRLTTAMFAYGAYHLRFWRCALLTHTASTTTLCLCALRAAPVLLRHYFCQPFMLNSHFAATAI